MTFVTSGDQEVITNRNHRLDAIRKYSDHLTEISRAYDRLRWMAEQKSSSDAFVVLAESAGAMTIDSLQQLSSLLDILWRAENRVERSENDKNQLMKADVGVNVHL